jgi:hypothetical protein
VDLFRSHYFRKLIMTDGFFFERIFIVGKARAVLPFGKSAVFLRRAKNYDSIMYYMQMTDVSLGL